MKIQKTTSGNSLIKTIKGQYEKKKIEKFVSKEWHKGELHKWKPKLTLDRQTRFNKVVKSHPVSIKFKEIPSKCQRNMLKLD